MSTSYITLSRQSGLLGEMQTIANNVANMSATGFRREEVMFSEYVKSGETPEDSISMASARVRQIDLSQGSLEATGGSLDVAIEGEGFFLVETPGGERLTRAGSFLPNGAGDLVTPDGHLVLDEGGAPIFIPPDSGDISIASDGTISAAGRPLSRLAVVRPSDERDLSMEGGALLVSRGAVEPVPDASLHQGFVEAANVNPVLEITRMIEVQRAYELGQAFNDRESDRVSKVIDTLTR